MKKYTIVPVFITMIAMCGCTKTIDKYTVNPNLPVSVPPSLLLRGIEYDMYNDPGNLADHGGQAERNCQFTCANFTYYGNNAYWDGVFHPRSPNMNYSTLTNVLNMENSARSAAGGSDNNPYNALGKFFRAWFFVSMSLKLGDIPMTQALLGASNLTPAYDSQKDVFIQANKWLDSANTELAGIIQSGVFEFSGDSYFADFLGNSTTPALIKWQKVVNSFRLRVLTHLSKQASDADLNVASQFTAILADPVKYPVMSDMSDNLQYVYNSTYNYYPTNTQTYGTEALRFNMAAAYTDSMASLHDLRVMMVAEPARGLGFPDTSYNSFRGAPSGLPLSIMAAGVNSNTTNIYCLTNRHRYYETLVGEPTLLLSYPETCFNIAEGINRGWATGDAESWYKKGIIADFGFYGVVDGANTVIFQQPSGVLGDEVSYTVQFSYDNYFNQPLVKYDAGNPAHGLEQILEQKYLAYFRNSGLEAYYQWRRTGVPGFLQGPDQSGYGNGGTIPLRYAYPLTEPSVNAANYTSAVASQYGGNDDINGVMWLIK
ncbi:MAG: SusD/RagB family nutrient-binding outer membrane lipoprotein [Bacteroidota bacterium]|nr:SusD/RagB family nutrient-binding outer membrane lipoprotein [Bacteroidota bacterium]